MQPNRTALDGLRVPNDLPHFGALEKQTTVAQCLLRWALCFIDEMLAP
jgi:hypothetical protein